MKTLPRGFSTLEILIAMAVMFLVLGAVILVSFGNQSAVADSQTDAEALNYAQGLLEQELALSRKDFNLVNSFSTSTPDGFYTGTVTSELQSDYLTKKVTAKVSWKGDHARNQSVSLVTLITNFTNAVGANTCNSTPSGDWTQPKIAKSYDLATLVGDAAGTYPITDVDAYQGNLYVTTNNPSGPITQPDLFVFSINASNSNAPTLTLVHKLDTDTANAGGLNAVAAATNSSGSYAFVANASGLTKGQFQAVDLSNYSVTSYKITGTQGLGNSISYRDGYAYLGLTSVGGSGKEFNVIDVHTPTTPFVRSSQTIGNDVNSIFVKGLYAYVATPSSQQVRVFDISNPNAPVAKGGYSGGGGNGKSIYAVGDTLYMGTAQGAGSLYNRIDASTPTALTLLNSKSYTTSVDGLLVRDSLAFVLTKASLYVINATSTLAWSGPLAIPGAASTPYESTLDCEGNMLFAGANDASNRGTLYLISPGP